MSPNTHRSAKLALSAHVDRDVAEDSTADELQETESVGSSGNRLTACYHGVRKLDTE